MAFVSLINRPTIPVFPCGALATTINIRSANDYLLDAASEKAAQIFQPPKDGDISKVGFLTGTVTTGDTVDVRIETVSTTDGFPTGTLADTNSNVSVAIADGDDDAWKTGTLTGNCTVDKNTAYALVIVNGSAPGNMYLSTLPDYWQTSTRFPYGAHYTTSWAMQVNRHIPFYLEYSDGSVLPLTQVNPVSSVTIRSYSSSSDPDHYGLKFQVPFPCKVDGAWIWSDLDGDCSLKLYDSDGTTVLTTVSLDANIRGATSAGIHFVEFDEQELSKDTNYRLVLEATTTTNIQLMISNYSSATEIKASPGGQNFVLTEKKDAGWTDTNTSQPMMGLTISALDDGVGGGSGGGSPFRGPLL